MIKINEEIIDEIEKKIDQKKRKRLLTWIIGIATPIFLGATLTWDITWRQWVTDSIYCQVKDQKVESKTFEGIQKEVKETKDSLDSFKKEVGTKFDDLTEKINKGQMEQMKLLREIDKKVK